MYDMNSVHPVKLAMALFSKRLIISQEYLLHVQETMNSTTKDPISICSDIIIKMYDALNKDANLCTPVGDVLKSIDGNIAKKFEAEMSKYNELILASTQTL